MKRALRLALQVLAGAVLLTAVLLGYVYWMFHTPSSDREYLYSQALDGAVAARADANTPAQFSEVMDFRTPLDKRPPGADPAAFAGTGPAYLYCRRTVATMRAAGPGECSAVSLFWGPVPPPICRLTACTVVSITKEQWTDPAFRAAINDPGLRARLCALRGPPHPVGWIRDSTGLLDCGPWWWARGLGFVAVETSDRRFEYHRLF